MRSAATKRYGPLPTISVTCVKASVAASRSGMITQGLDGTLPSASGSSGKGRLRRKRRVRSSGASSASIAASSAWPKVSRRPQRRTLAAQSRARTGSPSWKRRFSRSRSVQSRPSASAPAPSTICGTGRKALSMPNSVSKTRKA